MNRRIMPAELRAALNADFRAGAIFAGLASAQQRAHVSFVLQALTETKRAERAALVIRDIRVHEDARDRERVRLASQAEGKS